MLHFGGSGLNVIGCNGRAPFVHQPSQFTDHSHGAFHNSSSRDTEGPDVRRCWAEKGICRALGRRMNGIRRTRQQFGVHFRNTGICRSIFYDRCNMVSLNIYATVFSLRSSLVVHLSIHPFNRFPFLGCPHISLLLYPSFTPVLPSFIHSNQLQRLLARCHSSPTCTSLTLSCFSQIPSQIAPLFFLSLISYQRVT